MSPAEALLWNEFKEWRNQGIVIRRQHAINQYIVDFAHTKSKTVIEVDGRSHDEAKSKYDLKRQQELEGFGWRFIRISDSEALKNPNQVARPIFDLLA